MEILEFAAYLALGFVPTLVILEITYRIGIKIRKKKRVIVKASYPQTKSLLPIAFRV
jgi:hypothetical protein